MWHQNARIGIWCKKKKEKKRRNMINLIRSSVREIQLTVDCRKDWWRPRDDSLPVPTQRRLTRLVKCWRTLYQSKTPSLTLTDIVLDQSLLFWSVALQRFLCHCGFLSFCSLWAIHLICHGPVFDGLYLDGHFVKWPAFIEYTHACSNNSDCLLSYDPQYNGISSHNYSHVFKQTLWN